MGPTVPRPSGAGRGGLASAGGSRRCPTREVSEGFWDRLLEVLAGVGQAALDGAGGHGDGAGQEDAGVARAHAALVVAVAGADHAPAAGEDAHVAAETGAAVGGFHE